MVTTKSVGTTTLITLAVGLSGYIMVDTGTNVPSNPYFTNKQQFAVVNTKSQIEKQNEMVSPNQIVQKSCNNVTEALAIFPTMRGLTIEEIEEYDAILEKMSEPIGLNIYDI